MKLRPALAVLGLFFFLGAVATRLSGQVPDLVLLLKVFGVRQTSASILQTDQSGLGVAVEFPAPVSANTTVQLSGPTVIGIPRLEPQVYYLERYFANQTLLDSALPDGAYTLTVSGGGPTSSTPLLLSAAGDFKPVLFTNFDQLQAWPDNIVRFTWEPIAGMTPMDSLTLSVARADGTELFSTPDFGEPGALGASASFVDVDGLPLNETLNATLTSLRLNLSDANNGATVIATGRSFVTEVPVRLVLAKPIIARQPQSQTVAPGITVVFSAGATGNGLSYQWRRNGAPLAGATSGAHVIPNASIAVAGFYTVDITNISGSVTSDSVMLAINSDLLPSRITNLAIRSKAGIGSQTLIVGFAVGPTGLSGAKSILIRGIGPALGSFGVPDVLSDPRLELYLGPTKISENDDWGGSPQVSAVARDVGAFALNIPGSKDSALYNSTFGAGSYSVQLTASTGATGVALAEIYDATPGASQTTTTPRLINVSARSQVGSGADLLIAGFGITGQSPKTVLIRAVGPTLGSFGLQGALADPKLELFSGVSKLNENDTWGGGANLGSMFLNAGAFPLPATSQDATLLVTLAPGTYTAQVSGVNNSAGIALVEIYEIP